MSEIPAMTPAPSRHVAPCVCVCVCLALSQHKACLLTNALSQRSWFQSLFGSTLSRRSCLCMFFVCQRAIAALPVFLLAGFASVLSRAVAAKLVFGLPDLPACGCYGFWVYGLCRDEGYKFYIVHKIRCWVRVTAPGGGSNMSGRMGR